MNTYCVKCKKDTENVNSKIFTTKNNRLIMQSKCSVCRIKKIRKRTRSKGFIEYKSQYKSQMSQYKNAAVRKN